MKYFIVSDIHSHNTELIKTLNDNGFDFNNDSHILISLGDIFDRGSETIEVLKTLKSLKDNNRCILISGNHDDFLLDLIYGKYNNDYLFVMNHSGTLDTFAELVMYYGIENDKSLIINNISKYAKALKQKRELMDFLLDTRDYYYIKDYILTHSTLPYTTKKGKFVLNPKWQNAKEREWASAHVADWMMLYEFIDYPSKLIIGHIGSYRIRLAKKRIFDKKKQLDMVLSDLSLAGIYEDDKVIAIDGSVYETGIINCLVIEN